ncbi:cell cycle progression protein 1 [Centroberyx affinis]|uniref:cell cycle progression protein 1 n=1 Tax=Centroberyx affinis TaxID=166261 RepID=UPI003A5C0607
MSETSSDAESSCGWTIISNEGSDIETLGPEAAVEYGTELLENPAVEPQLQDPPASLPGAGCAEERGGDSHDDTLKEQTLDETLSAAEAGGGTAGKEHVTLWSSSDHSDIVTLGDMKDDEHAAVEEEAAANEQFYLGTSSSSQYAFSAAETVFPVQQPAVSHSSSSEDEAVESTTPVVRRRRLRKNTTSVATEPEEEALESGPSEEEEEEEEEVGEEVQQEEQGEVQPTAPPLQGHIGGILNKCILLALIIAISMGFGHFYGTVQIQERQKTVEKIRENELGDVRDLLQQHLKEHIFTSQGVIERADLDERDIMESLPGIMERVTNENQELKFKQVQIQAQRDNLELQLKQTTEERTNMASWQQKLTAENQLLKNSLEREEKSLSTLQEELRNLRSKIRDLEDRGAGTDSLLSENQRLKDQLEEEKQLIRSFRGQRESLMAEIQTLRKELHKERMDTDQLRKELIQLSSHSTAAGEEANAETEELQSRLMELEKKLSFEQQRSDLWERLYVETKEERAKGDTQSKVKKTKDGMAGKVKETFDAVKNSTKEFVHHHKEQIKKAKEAVKENLRKFSDSVKSTFRHFKDSASTFINKARGSYSRKFGEKDAKESWQHRSHKPHHRHPHKPTDDSFHSNHNTRKSGSKVQEDQDTNAHKTAPKGCSGVFDCAYQESMSLFNIAMEPIRADEFNQLLQSYLQQEVDHFRHWKELEKFINNFFRNGVFIHDQMLFTDFVSDVEDYLEDMHEYRGLDDDVFEDLDEYVYRHFFGDTYSKNYGPSRPFDRPDAKEEPRVKQQQRKQQKARPRPQRERKWSRSGRNADRHMADVKIELGPMPFDPKY